MSRRNSHDLDIRWHSGRDVMSPEALQADFSTKNDIWCVRTYLLCSYLERKYKIYLETFYKVTLIERKFILFSNSFNADSRKSFSGEVR